MRRRFSPGDFDIKIKRSRTGRGLFAGEKIKRGSCVIEYIGKPATKKQIKENKGKYLFWTGRGTMIDGYIPANKARFINHSCAPNCEIDIKNRRVYIFAIRPIKEGEEITYNYGVEYYDTHFLPDGCKCVQCLEERSKKKKKKKLIRK